MRASGTFDVRIQEVDLIGLNTSVPCKCTGSASFEGKSGDTHRRIGNCNEVACT